MPLPELDWSNFDSAKGGNGDDPDRIVFLRFERDRTYRIRPIGNAVQFYKFFIEKGKPSIVVSPKFKDAAMKMLSEHSGNEYKPSYRCAMFILDRSDGRVKVMEGGFQIFDSFAKWSQATGVQPGHGQGGDWNISVEGDGVGGSNPRKYTTVFLGNSVFSDNERAMLKKLKAEDKLHLGNFLPETPLDQLLERAFGVKPSENSPEPPVVAASSDGMGW